MQSVVTLSVVNAECRKQARNSKCHYAECRGAHTVLHSQISLKTLNLECKNMI
jgi:hypothetical protein